MVKKQITANTSMVDTDHTHNSENSTPQRDQHPTGGTTLRRVWQDKGAEYRATTGTTQPASEKKCTRARQLDTETTRSQNRDTDHQRTEKVTIWLKPRVKKALERIAASENLSISATGGAFLEQAIQSDLHTQHGALLETIINQAISNGMRAYSNRLASLLVRVAFTSEQTRGIVTNILTRQPGVTPEVLKTVLDGSSKTAKRNLSQKIPQLTELIIAITQWMEAREEETGS